MSADVQLLALERGEGESRLVVRWLDTGQRHALEVAVERRAAEGWTLARRVVVGLSELHLVRDALDKACALAGTVRR